MLNFNPSLIGNFDIKFQFKPFSELESKFKRIQGLDKSAKSNDEREESEDAAFVASLTKEDKKSEKPKVAQPAEPEDEDDDLEYFRRLSQED